ncbi:MAG: cellulase family glycosylhydrolase [Chthoniobacterales bacterium]
MRRHLLASLAIALAPLGALFAIEPGTVFLLTPQTTPDLPPSMGWVPEGPTGGQALRVDVIPAEVAKNHLVTIPLDVVPLRDHEILLTYDVRADQVTKPELDYNGIKCQLHYQSVAEGPKWFNEGLLYGTFPWQRSSLLIRVDSDASDGVLQIGMQECSGTAWIANLTVEVLRRRPGTFDNPAFRGHDLPRLRGFVGPAAYDPNDFDVLEEWNVNLLRWQLINPDWERTAIPADQTIYGPWLDKKATELQTVLDRAQEAGIRVIVDLHAPPGGRLADGTLTMLTDQKLQDVFVEIWKELATRFKDHPALWAYDPLNEPVQNRPAPAGVNNWWQLQKRTAEAIRKIDPDTPILIEVDQWDSPEAFVWMEPIDVPRVIYQVHMYWPHEYTHQGIDRSWINPDDKPTYPGTWNDRPFDRDALRRKLQPVRDFQLKHNVHILVGEFSVPRWAPGAAQYLADNIALFEEYGWDWTYHAFRESPEWSLELANLPYSPAIQPEAGERTDRAEVVRSWLDKNE